MRRIYLVALAILLSLSIAIPAYCANEGNRNFVFILGSVSKIDAADPDNVKIELTNDADNTTHAIEITPATNILKVIDTTDLKIGEKVRVMARKAENKEVAMSIVTGKMKLPPRPKGLPPSAQPVKEPPVKK